MNKMRLIVVLLALHIFIVRVYANKESVHPNKCGLALSGSKEELSVYFQAIEQEDLKTLLTFDSWDINTKYEVGQILLSYAAQQGKVESIKVLVSQIGIDVNGRDRNGRTALHHAVLNPDIISRTNTIYTLVQLKADVYATDHSDNRPSKYVQDDRHATITREQEYKAVYLALKVDDILEVAELLQIRYNVLPHLVWNFRTNHDLPIH